MKEFFGKASWRGLARAEVVALGAAVQAGILEGRVMGALFLDATPFTLSVETLGSVATALIERNTTIPVQRSEIFSTVNDGQTSVDIRVYQGEHLMAADNVLLGQFRLDGIPAAPKGIPQIEVTFDIDSDGILNVFAEDKATGQEQRVTIVAHGGRLAPAAFGKGPCVSKKKHVATAKRPAVLKKERPEDIQTRLDAEDLIREAEEVSSERGDALPVPVREVVDSKVHALRVALQRGRTENIQHRTWELDEVLDCTEALGEPDPAPAMGMFVELFKGEKDSQIRERIWQALVQISGQVETAAEALKRHSRVDGLATTPAKKPKTRGVKQLPVKLLVAALKSGNPHLRRRAAGALGCIGDETAIQPLTEALRDEDDVVRREAIQALARFAVEPLMTTLEDAGVNMQQEVPCQLPSGALWAWLLDKLDVL